MGLRGTGRHATAAGGGRRRVAAGGCRRVAATTTTTLVGVAWWPTEPCSVAAPESAEDQPLSCGLTAAAAAAAALALVGDDQIPTVQAQ